VLDLRPGDRHRNRCMRPRSGRERRYCCRKLVVSKIVEKYLPHSFCLAHIDQVAVRAFARHLAADVAGKLLRLGPVQLLSFFRARKWRHNVRPLPPVVLQMTLGRCREDDRARPASTYSKFWRKVEQSRGSVVSDRDDGEHRHDDRPRSQAACGSRPRGGQTAKMLGDASLWSDRSRGSQGYE
jgi:hypothetical protein